MDKQMNTRRILIFLIFAVGIPWIATLAAYLAVGTEGIIKLGSLPALVFGFAPALANVATRLITKEGWGSLGLRPNRVHSTSFA